MFNALLFWLRKGRQAQDLAINAEVLASDINALPVPDPKPERDIVSVLESTCALLQRFIELQEKQQSTIPEGGQAVFSPQTVSSEVFSMSSTKETLSVTAQELMKLGDWVLLAKAGGASVKPEVLGEIHRQLIKVLAKEGVTLLNETGLCDYERQAVVGTHPTDDPAQNDHIYSTVRPGYLFHGQVIRPQEVIIYANRAHL